MAPSTEASQEAPKPPESTQPPPSPLQALREPFPREVIGLLPKQLRRNVPDSEKSKCKDCGAYVGPHIHLDYVGHAAVTDRLLTVDPYWYWEPLAMSEDGLPLYRDSPNGTEIELWISLHVHTGTGFLGQSRQEISRLGVGIVDKSASDLGKQLISDAIKNAAMRFGVALELWTKDELESASTSGGEKSTRRRRAPGASTAIDASTEGKTGWPAKQRNAVISHLAHLDPPVRDADAQMMKVATLLNLGEPKPLVKLTQEEGTALMVALGIDK